MPFIATDLADQSTALPARPAGLYVVATPIGNLADISQRALEVLATVDVIACEDTRITGKLLAHHHITTPTCAYHDHNSTHMSQTLIRRMQQGQSIALVSDAGTPLISDPGYSVVQQAHAQRLSVTPIAGPCAAIAALSAAGMPSDKFAFIGFLPAKTHGRQAQLEQLSARTDTLIFYEAPHRIIACVQDMIAVLGTNRPVAFCRELSKTFETIINTTLAELLELIQADPNQQKGEMVLVVGGAPKTPESHDMHQHDTLLLRLRQDLSVKKAAALAADLTGHKKNALYQRLLELQQTER